MRPQGEIIRQERQIARDWKAADFREPKTLENFDWEFHRAIKKKQMYDLAAGGLLLVSGNGCLTIRDFANRGVVGSRLNRPTWGWFGLTQVLL